MKKYILLITLLFMALSLSACMAQNHKTDILTTTAPLHYFTQRICDNTDIYVDCLLSENISCLHDYTLQPNQMRSIENAKLVIVSGAGLEDSFTDILGIANDKLDCAAGVSLISIDADHDHHSHDTHEHDQTFDPHIWLSPSNAIVMAQNIYVKLCSVYPHHKVTFALNFDKLIGELNALHTYATAQLSNLSIRKIITFHDGFAYMAEDFGLDIIRAIEEESGREASAAELVELCLLIEQNNIPCIFTETNGSTSAAHIIAAETGVKVFQLNTAISGCNYIEAMYQNIDTLKEALG